MLQFSQLLPSITLFVAASAFIPIAEAETPACLSAREIVADVAEALTAGTLEHKEALLRLTTARNLCPSLSEAWKMSSCSARALGENQAAQIYRYRAVLNGATDLSCAPTAPPPPQPFGPVRDKYALVIGIGLFQDPAVPSLRWAAKDARDFAAVLTDPLYGRFTSENVVLLTDDQATRSNILISLQSLLLRMEEEDLFVLYLSSHGSPRRAGNGLGGVGYVWAYDSDHENLWLNSIDFAHFAELLAVLKPRRKVLFLDTCHSGLASLELPLYVDLDQQTSELTLAKSQGVYMITSSRADETSFESETLQNSYFTHYLLSALRQPLEPPSLREVFAMVAREVPAAVRREKGKSQHPQLLPIGAPADIRIGVVPQPLGAAPGLAKER